MKGINGTYQRYHDIVFEAYANTRVANPVLKYDHEQGFFVSSTMSPNYDDEISLGAIVTNSTIGSHAPRDNHDGSVAEYTRICARIIAALGESPASKAAAALGKRGRAVNSEAQQETARANGSKGGATKGQPGIYEYTVIVDGQDGKWSPARSIQGAKMAARKEAQGYGSLAKKAIVARVDDGQRTTVATLSDDGYNWAGRGTWRTE